MEGKNINKFVALITSLFEGGGGLICVGGGRAYLIKKRRWYQSSIQN